MSMLQDSVAYVTGGASGLGRAIVERFVEEGARVAVLDRSADRLEDLKKHLGDDVITCCGDVRQLADHEKAVGLAVDRFGSLDTFVGNAGIWDYQVPLADIPADSMDDAFAEMMEINVGGYLKGAKAALPSLVRARGSIVLTLSNAAFYTNGGGILYTVSKFAGVGVVKELAYELGPRVRVNGVAPGPLESDLRGPESLGLSDTSISTVPLRDMVEEHSPLLVMPTADDYVAAYALLASKRHSRVTTGAILNVDGGVGIRGLVAPSGGGDLLERVERGEL